MFYVQRQRKGDGVWIDVACRALRVEADEFAHNHPSLQNCNVRVIYRETAFQTKEDVRAGRY